MSPFVSPPFIIAILIAISVHEWGHGFVAYKLGDPTAQMDGRLSLNPLAHLDPIGTLMFLIIGFGWAKPVPIDPRYFKNHKRDTTLVALAGP
ncbi:MAG: site-2 protease family protein, partial [Patescibacteria group bacterium]